MNILLLSTDSFGGYGGIALYNRDLALALARFCVAPATPPAAFVSQSEPPALQQPTNVVLLPRIIPNATGPLPAGVTFVEAAAHGPMAYVRELRRAKRQTRFDLVICSHINLLPIARMATKHPVLFVYGIEAWRPQRRMSTPLIRDCRAIVAISDVTRSRLVSWSHFAGPTFLLPNAIRAEQYGIRPKRADLIARYGLEGKRVVLTVGRISRSERYKGFDEIIDILPALPADVVFLIAGGGDDVERLQKKAMHCGVADRVRFAGLFAEDEKADLYSLADVYAMPSRGEGFGYVILEAMASGVPVIASKHDGGREAILNGELGTLVDPANPAEIRAAIADALDARERKIPNGLGHFAFERFTERVHAIVRAVA